jgi:large subunit ribosomal protein L4e
MQVTLKTTDGDAAGDATLPGVFETEHRPDVIRKAVDVAEANQKQPYGAAPEAGRQHATESWGPGRGASRIPRLTQGREAAFAPGTRGGRRAHPPKAEKDLSEDINAKERDLALASALAATADAEAVADRGHEFEADELPLVVEDDIVDLAKTQQLKGALEALGLGDDLARAKEGRSIRSGRGTTRGRKYRTPRSVLLVVHETGTIDRSSSNLPGVEYATVESLNVPRLAPGGDPGRLTVYTASALDALEEVKA